MFAGSWLSSEAPADQPSLRASVSGYQRPSRRLHPMTASNSDDALREQRETTDSGHALTLMSGGDFLSHELIVRLKLQSKALEKTAKSCRVDPHDASYAPMTVNNVQASLWEPGLVCLPVSRYQVLSSVDKVTTAGGGGKQAHSNACKATSCRGNGVRSMNHVEQTSQEAYSSLRGIQINGVVGEGNAPDS
ncbi:hypothetical protein RRG08_047930 [Elysia crispata]|uniref:Uncharacterized protein n=1 Tax=Elysia crispata TaxID=231223 RepID=A0AAE0ZLH7_9GAST|nr:hypothetical protein RRG08_047930 [Elysia crispata]